VLENLWLFIPGGSCGYDCRLLKWLEPVDRKIVWLRAYGERWKQVCWKAKLQRAAAHEHRVNALCIVAARLNGQKALINMSKRRFIEISLATDAAKLSGGVLVGGKSSSWPGGRLE
jgi:hypothetical protein